MAISFSRDSSAFLLETEQVLPAKLEDVFDFFSKAENLEQLTPAFLKFQILTPTPIEMKEGVCIDYRIKVHGIPLRWRSIISQFEAPNSFVDEQLHGPYRFWIHEHRFKSLGDNTEVKDRIRYWPIGGALIHSLFVKRDLEKIFAFRQKKLESVFAD